jgi:hypothetical protein
VEKPLLSYDALYGWVAGILLVLALVVWRVRSRR